MFVFEDRSETSHVPSAKPFDAMGHGRNLKDASSNNTATGLAGSDDTSEDSSLGAFKLVDDLLERGENTHTGFDFGTDEDFVEGTAGSGGKSTNVHAHSDKAICSRDGVIATSLDKGLVVDARLGNLNTQILETIRSWELLIVNCVFTVG